MFQKLKQYKELRDQGKQMKALLDDIAVVGSSRGQQVMITINGSHEVLGVQIADNLDKTTVEQGIKDAMADCSKKLQQELVKKVQANGGLEGLKEMMG